MKLRIATYYIIFVLCPVYSFLHGRSIRLNSNLVLRSFDYESILTQLSSAAVAAASVATTTAVSIPVDYMIQNGVSRISKIANHKITDDLGDVYAYLARPQADTKSTKRPVVILVHQFFGLRERDTELCDELAKSGYFAIAPDCFQGNTTSLIPR